jgi:hypothetical protein
MNDRGQSNPDLNLPPMALPPEPPPDESWLPIDTYTAGPNLRVVALECAVASGVSATNVLTYADQFLEWLEADG